VRSGGEDLGLGEAGGHRGSLIADQMGVAQATLLQFEEADAPGGTVRLLFLAGEQHAEMLVLHQREHRSAVVVKFVGCGIDRRIRQGQGLELLRGAHGGVLEDPTDAAGGDVLFQHGLDAGLGAGVGGVGVNGQGDNGPFDAVPIDNERVATGRSTRGLGRQQIEAGMADPVDDAAGGLAGDRVPASEFNHLTAARVGNDGCGFG